ncbi:MAG: NAD(P)H-hydrate dehydratase [Candidatus Polarisedimenticolia bacterium]
MKILTAEQMRRIDQRAEREHGIPSVTLMDNAGRAVAQTLLRLFPEAASRPAVIVCGKGNNGGDGIAAARHLQDANARAVVLLLAHGADLTGPSAHHLDLARKAGIVVEETATEAAWKKALPRLAEASVVVDAILGTGLTGPSRGLAGTAIAGLNGAETPVISVDLPSGLSADTGDLIGPAVRASHTIALACPKMCHTFGPAATLCGQLHVVDIGIPFEAVQAEQARLNLVSEEEVAGILAPREADSHKGDYGRLLVVGGSRGKSGAPALACRAALRSGAGLVTAAAPASAQAILAGHVMEMMTEPLPETDSGTLSAAAAGPLAALESACDVMAVGPGLTALEETAALVRALVTRANVPVVLDADGLNAFVGRAAELRGESRPLILTPHPGEMGRLMGRPGETPITPAAVQKDRVGAVRTFAMDHACYVVLKGHGTLVADPDGEIWMNPTGNPGMATGGTGDALTGIIAALMAQGLSPLESCVLGVYVHGLAGDLAAADLGETSMMAGDLIEYLPEAFLHLERAAP